MHRRGSVRLTDAAGKRASGWASFRLYADHHVSNDKHALEDFE